MADFNNTNEKGDIDNLNNDTVIPGNVGKIEGDTSTLNQTIPGATHAAQNLNIDAEDIVHEEVKQPNAATASGSEKSSKEHFNSDFDEMNPQEQDQSAADTAALIINGYCQLKLLAGTMVAISDRKLKKLDRQGLIDIDMAVKPRNAPFPIPLTDYVNSFNNTIYGPLQPRPGFVETVTPILTRILKKRGAVLSDEGILAGHIAEDLIITTQSLGKAFNQRVDFIDELKDMYQRKKEQAPAAPVTADAPGAKDTVEKVVENVEKS